MFLRSWPSMIGTPALTKSSAPLFGAGLNPMNREPGIIIERSGPESPTETIFSGSMELILAKVKLLELVLKLIKIS